MVYKPGTNAVDMNNDPSGVDAGSVTDTPGVFAERGWALLALVLIAFVIAPLVVIVHPPDMLPFLVAYLVLPLIIAVTLGLVAVWATIRS